MNLTSAMRRFAGAKGWIQDGATDDDLRRVLGAKLAGGEISGEAWNMLLADKDPDARGLLTAMMDDRLGALETRLETRLVGLLSQAGLVPAGAGAGGSAGGAGGAGGAGVGTGTGGTGSGGQTGDRSQGGTGTGTGVGAGGQSGQNTPDFQGVVGRQVQNILAAHGFAVPTGDGQEGERVNPTQLLTSYQQRNYLGAGNVRVKSVIEKFDQHRAEATYPGNSKHIALRGKRVTFPSEMGPGMGRPLFVPSQADKAVIGAWFKWSLHCRGYAPDLPSRYRLTPLDWELVKYALHELPWTGTVGGSDEDGENPNVIGVDGVKLTDVNYKGQPAIKAILDDSTSGGINAAPQIFEDALILVPLLYGELFPEVTVVNLARGRRIYQATMGTPTFTSGISEGTAVPLFDTTNFIGALNFTIFPTVGAMEIGLDFEEDSPADIGGAVVARYGEASLQWLDQVIATGDGTTQPMGIFNTPGATTVASANGAAGPLTIADAEALMFGVNKAYRTSRGGRNVFIGNEINYRRFRQIPLATGWNERVFGDQYGDYQVLGHPFKIVPTIPNTNIAYQNMAYYRMYRRLGLTVKIVTEGKELSLKNQKLIVVRMRWGGQCELGGSTALMTTAPA